jgi:predicted GTPase
MKIEVVMYCAGKTGVGKSTLINAVFQGNFAATGQRQTSDPRN